MAILAGPKEGHNSTLKIFIRLIKYYCDIKEIKPSSDYWEHNKVRGAVNFLLKHIFGNKVLLYLVFLNLERLI